MTFEKPPQNNADKDLEYTRKFQENMIAGQREVMEKHIVESAQAGSISIFTSREVFDEEDKQKMSAFRTLAKKMGYEIGQFTINKGHDTATASIKKIEENK
ncbi:MAG: hypothetical protein WCV59_01160 [Parcubacteria group bacterium]|jgi:hypothetical protein